MVAALYVTPGGCYYGLPDVDPWDELRDARRYTGDAAVVAHPPCERWGRYWFGSPRAAVQSVKGADGGCFDHALGSVRKWGGVLEHPAGSHAWPRFGIVKPPSAGGWVQADNLGGWTCHVEQGNYGHQARKPTWLYAVRTGLPPLLWGPTYGPVIPVKDLKPRSLRWVTPTPFRDVLLSMARSV